ncbi:hypothetical protein DFH07DRAFT_1059053 [Mycena maculata]|uniref:F-box domain-containing protein n=1 Tax=Mycena maculata TaxID=230809 RepID=A0AAD7NKM8_9AGAR|nr:hypothetical protein DFH07DRAFT_1059053 [Mycena maculata]
MTGLATHESGPDSSTSLIAAAPSPQPPPAIFSFPDELLVEIAAAGQRDRDPAPVDQFQSEWNLSHVSRRFRDAIIGAPTLWTLVTVKLRVEGSVELFKLYLERSRACKIRVTLYEMSYRVMHMDSHFIAHQLRHLVPHIGRIWRLRLVSEVQESMDAMLVPFRDVAAPALEHLAIESYDQLDIPMNIFSSGAPNLTFFKLSSCILNFPVPPWTTHLTHLDLRSCSDSHDSEGNSFLSTFLTQCPALAHFFLDTTVMGLNRMKIPSLESLTVVTSNDGDALDLRRTFHDFEMPLLSSLVVQYTHGDQISALFNQTSHLSFPALTSLSFVNGGCECEYVSENRAVFQTISSPPLRLFPILSSLTLINQCFTEDILSDILGPTSQPWPSLKSVSICPKEGKLEVVYSTLQQVVRSRRQSQAALPNLWLSPPLFAKGYWEENGVDVELFDCSDLVAALH